ncbi:MAG: SDR family oxidoreductase [Polyangiaceae bacterium]
MAVLVTGIKGLVGSRVARLLLADGEDVIGVARGGPPDPSRFGNGTLRFAEHDLADASALHALVVASKPAGIVHCAAMTNVDACEREPALAWAVNVEATAAIARGAKDVGARLVALSTDYVFDGTRGDYREEDVPNPRGVYARTKRAGEEAALLLAPDCVVARVSTIFTGDSRDKRTYAFDLASKLVAGTKSNVFHDQVVSPTHAENAAGMSVCALRSDVRGVLHCTGAEALTRVHFAKRLAARLHADLDAIVPVALADLKLPAPRPLLSGLDVSKAKALFGDAGPWSLERALDLFVREFRTP